MTYVPERDDNGQLIAELSTPELQRRIQNLRDAGTGDWRSTMFRRAYELLLKERGVIE